MVVDFMSSEEVVNATRDAAQEFPASTFQQFFDSYTNVGTLA
jgi:hypothetical protein